MHRARAASSLLRRRVIDNSAALAMLVLASVAAAPSHALIGAVDDVPAATLLFPYFEVDLDNPAGVTTLINITNASATAILAHMTIWSDLGVPLFQFDTYLTGYDVQSFNLRDILTTGVLPQDASAGQDPQDKFSPHGQFSQDINFASCTGVLPKQPIPATWTAPTTTSVYFTGLDALQKELTGKQTPRQRSAFPPDGINCVAHDYGDRIARGYLTVDTTNSCSGNLNPSDWPAYSARITFQNVMMGDYMIINPSTKQLQLGNAAHTEAAQSSINGMPYTPIGAGNYTFYGRYNNWDTTDQREPLATNWAGLGAVGHTDAIVWRDNKTPYNFNTGFTCPAVPGASPNGVAWQPLTAEQLLAFDVEEGAVSPLGVFAYATGRYGLGTAAMPIPITKKLGWVFSNLNAPIAGVVKPTVDPAALQAFVTFARRPEGGAMPVSSGATGFNMDSALAPNTNHTPLN